MNRRLEEIQKQKRKFEELLDNSQTLSDCLACQGKLELLEKEEKEILAKM